MILKYDFEDWGDFEYEPDDKEYTQALAYCMLLNADVKNPTDELIEIVATILSNNDLDYDNQIIANYYDELKEIFYDKAGNSYWERTH